MHATADKLTPIMLSSHVYWYAHFRHFFWDYIIFLNLRNLEAYQESQDLNQHFAEFQASRIIAGDGILIPTGKITDIDGTAADFRKSKSIGQAISQTKAGEFCGTGNTLFKSTASQIAKCASVIGCTGFDNCWLYDSPKSQAPKFSIWSANSGIK